MPARNQRLVKARVGPRRLHGNEPFATGRTPRARPRACPWTAAAIIGPLNRSAVRILVIDDEPFILKLHARLLADLGFGFTKTFESGVLALDEIDRAPAPDLILLDIAMPGMDGTQFIRHLAKRSYGGGVVLITGEDQRLLPTVASIAAEAGLTVVGQLHKPVTPARLGSLLEEWERWLAGVKSPASKIYSRDEIQGGIRRREMVNHYQPKVCLRTGDLLGVECLARWQHPVDGLVLPGLFIDIAERTGLIDELARVTIAAAVSEIHDLALGGLGLQLSLNVSASLLSSMDFAAFVAAASAEAFLMPRNVCLEVTESQIIADPRTPLEVLVRLRLLGFGLSIDDFGTGYSSFAQLSNIPFDELKIDRRFVHGASSDPTARAIYDCCLALAQSLPIRSVAEGVEDRVDWDLAQGTGCDEAQGYLIARPMEAFALPAWHEQWKSRRRTEFGFAS